MTGEIPLLMTCLCPDLGSASDWLCHKGNLLQPIRNTTQAWVVTCRQYGISTLIFQVAFRGETSGGAAKGQLFLVFSQATNILLNNHNEGWSSLKGSETDNCVNFHGKKSGWTTRIADVCCTSSDFKEVINVEVELKISRNKNYS